MKRGAEKPDYARIAQLEKECGIDPLPSVVVDGTDPGPIKVLVGTAYDRFVADHRYFPPMITPPPKVEELSAQELKRRNSGDSQYQVYLLNDCTKDPRWWANGDD